MADTIVEVSGADYTGKTTHADLLTFTPGVDVHNFGGKKHYSDMWPPLMTPAEDWEWWFRETSLSELGAVLLDGYTRRQEVAYASDYDIAVVEKGAVMVRSQLAANFATRNEVGVDHFVEEADAFVSNHSTDPDAGRRRLEVVLESDEQWQSCQANAMPYIRNGRDLDSRYSGEQNEFYARYLQNLRQAIRHFHSGEVIPVNRSTIEVQDEIRALLANKGLPFAPILGHRPLVVGITGQHDSGSIVSEVLEQDFNFVPQQIPSPGENNPQIPGNVRGGYHAAAIRIIGQLVERPDVSRVLLGSEPCIQLSAELRTLMDTRWRLIFVDDESRLHDDTHGNDAKVVPVTLDMADLAVPGEWSREQVADYLSEGLNL